MLVCRWVCTTIVRHGNNGLGSKRATAGVELSMAGLTTESEYSGGWNGVFFVEVSIVHMEIMSCSTVVTPPNPTGCRHPLRWCGRRPECDSLGRLPSSWTLFPSHDRDRYFEARQGAAIPPHRFPDGRCVRDVHDPATHGGWICGWSRGSQVLHVPAGQGKLSIEDDKI